MSKVKRIAFFFCMAVVCMIAALLFGCNSDESTCEHKMTKHDGVSATCLSEGTKEYYTCSVCIKNFEDEKGTKEITNIDTWKVITALGHSFGDNHAEVAPVCEAAGVKGYKDCMRCNKHFALNAAATESDANAITDLTTPASGHTYGELIPENAATCVSAGTKAHYHCVVCGKDFIETEGAKVEVTAEALALPIDSSNHASAENKEKQEPTCGAAGRETGVYCSACQTWVSGGTEIAATGNHTATPTEKDAETCTTSGTKEYYTCSVCGKHFEDKNAAKEISDFETWVVIPATGHTYSEWSVTTTPGSDTEGAATRICSVCAEGTEGHTQTKTLPVLTNGGYTITNDTATCSAKGTGTYAITIDEVMFIFSAETPINENAHSYGEQIKKVAATCTQTGKEAHYKCFSCNKLFVKNGEEYQEKTEQELIIAIDKDAHEYSDTYSYDVNNGGEGHYRICTYNSAHHSAVEAHKYNENGVCETCGYALPKELKSYFTFDGSKLNGNSAVTTDGSAQVKKNTSKEKLTVTCTNSNDVGPQVVSAATYSNLTNIEYDITFNDNTGELTWAGFAYASEVPKSVYTCAGGWFSQRFKLLAHPDGNVSIEKGVKYHVLYKDFGDNGYVNICITNTSTNVTVNTYNENTNTASVYLMFFNELGKDSTYTIENFTITADGVTTSGISDIFEFKVDEVTVDNVDTKLSIGSVPTTKVKTGEKIYVPASGVESVQFITKEKLNNIKSIEFDITLSEDFVPEWGGLGFYTTTESITIYTEMKASCFMARLTKGQTYHAKYIFTHSTKYIQANFTCGETTTNVENNELTATDGCYYLGFYWEAKNGGGCTVANFKVVTTSDGVDTECSSIEELFNYPANAELTIDESENIVAGYTHAELVEKSTINNYLLCTAAESEKSSYASVTLAADGENKRVLSQGNISYTITGEKEIALVLSQTTDGVADYLLITKDKIALYNGATLVKEITAASEAALTLKVSEEGVLTISLNEAETEMGTVGTVSGITIVGLGGTGSIEISNAVLQSLEIVWPTQA